MNRDNEIFLGLAAASFTVIFGIFLGMTCTELLAELLFRALQAL